MSRDYMSPNGMFLIGQKVKLNKAICGWFDYSVKREIPAGTGGVIFKVEKISHILDEIEYTVKFDVEFDYVKIKHKDLENL